MSRSKKHHYVPKFYLRSFLNEGGQYHIWDKERDAIYTGNPENSFYEKHRNTVNRGTEEEDQSIERLYGEIEVRVAPSLEELQKCPLQEDLPVEALGEVLYFASLMLWRVPAMDEKHREILKNVALKDLGWVVRNRETGESLPEEVERGLMEDEGMELLLRISNSTLAFSPSIFKEDKGNWKLLEFGLPILITSDNPVLTPQNDPIRGVSGSFIFPISPSRYLVNTANGVKEGLNGMDGLLMAVAIAKQAKRFVCGPDRRTLEFVRLALQFPGLEMFEGEILARVFQQIDRGSGGSQV